MKIVCVGGGPARLYFAISAKLRDAGHEITIIERDPPGATYGWCVVCQDNLLDKQYRNDHESAGKIRAAAALWQEQEVILRGDQVAYLPGYGFSVSRPAPRRAHSAGRRPRGRHAAPHRGAGPGRVRRR
jgi:anthraniloyl-CoA monooxygenase